MGVKNYEEIFRGSLLLKIRKDIEFNFRGVDSTSFN